MPSNPIKSNFDAERLKQGDEVALKEFFDQLVPKLYLYGSRLKHFGPLDVEDAVSETVVRVFRKIDSIAELENPNGYCFGVMKNVMRERQREIPATESIDHILTQEDTDEVLHFPVEPITEFVLADAATTSELAMAVEKALSELSDNDRQLVEMHMAGFTYEEIAASLGNSKDAARKRYHRVVRALRHAVQNYYTKAKTG